MCALSESAAPSSTVQALAMVSAGLGFLAGCDAAALGTATQAEALVGLEQAEAKHTAARARILAAFTAQDGFQADGHYGPKAWLRAYAKITKGAAAGAAGWARRLAAHPVIADALAAGQLSASWARQICDWTDKLPEDHRATADQILLAAAVGGADIHDLGTLAREMIERSRTSPDHDDGGFGDRALWLETTLAGAGRLQGDLTPACAAALTVVLDALAQKAGPEDTRTMGQRRHDALEEACRRLIGAQMVPGHDGQPAHLQVHVDLGSLRDLPGASAAEGSWSPARAAVVPGSVYLAGAAAGAAACDAALTPVVTGQIDWSVLDQLTGLILAGSGHNPRPEQDARCTQDGGCTQNGSATQRGGHREDPAQPTAGDHTGACRVCGKLPGQDTRPGPGRRRPLLTAPLPRTSEIDPGTRERLQRTLLQWSIDLLSGPGGLAAHLRTGLLGRPFSSLSQPLDLGRSSRSVPPSLRQAVILRDMHCQFPGCRQPSSVCEAHHLIPWFKGGTTSLGNLRLLCRFHHLIVIHRWGWTLAGHSDGTTTATSPGGRVLHSHSPPGQRA